MGQQKERSTKKEKGDQVAVAQAADGAAAGATGAAGAVAKRRQPADDPPMTFQDRVILFLCAIVLICSCVFVPPYLEEFARAMEDIIAVEGTAAQASGGGDWNQTGNAVYDEEDGYADSNATDRNPSPRSAVYLDDEL